MMTVVRRAACVIGALVLLLLPVSSFAFTVPVNDGFVTDTVGLLTPEQDAELEAKLEEYKQKTSNEIAIVIVQGMSGADVMQEGFDLLRKWGIGESEKNNGVVILVGYADHAIGIITGTGLEGALPDIVVKGISDTDITPHFREGKYYQGLASAIDSLQKHIGGEFTADRYILEEDDGWSAFIFFFVFIVIEWLAAFLGRTKSWWLGGVIGACSGALLVIMYEWLWSVPILTVIGLIFDYIVSRAPRTRRGRRGGRGGWSSGGGGWSSGGGTSGGFSGFSGGSTSGGGARGSW